MHIKPFLNRGHLNTLRCHEGPELELTGSNDMGLKYTHPTPLLCEDAKCSRPHIMIAFSRGLILACTSKSNQYARMERDFFQIQKILGHDVSMTAK